MKNITYLLLGLALATVQAWQAFDEGSRRFKDIASNGYGKMWALETNNVIWEFNPKTGKFDIQNCGAALTISAWKNEMYILGTDYKVYRRYLDQPCAWAVLAGGGFQAWTVDVDGQGVVWANQKPNNAVHYYHFQTNSFRATGGCTAEAVGHKSGTGGAQCGGARYIVRRTGITGGWALDPTYAPIVHRHAAGRLPYSKYGVFCAINTNQAGYYDLVTKRILTNNTPGICVQVELMQGDRPLIISGDNRIWTIFAHGENPKNFKTMWKKAYNWMDKNQVPSLKSAKSVKFTMNASGASLDKSAQITYSSFTADLDNRDGDFAKNIPLVWKNGNFNNVCSFDGINIPYVNGKTTFSMSMPMYWWDGELMDSGKKATGTWGNDLTKSFPVQGGQKVTVSAGQGLKYLLDIPMHTVKVPVSARVKFSDNTKQTIKGNIKCVVAGSNWETDAEYL